MLVEWVDRCLVVRHGLINLNEGRGLGVGPFLQAPRTRAQARLLDFGHGASRDGLERVHVHGHVAAHARAHGLGVLQILTGHFKFRAGIEGVVWVNSVGLGHHV